MTTEIIKDVNIDRENSTVTLTVLNKASGEIHEINYYKEEYFDNTCNMRSNDYIKLLEDLKHGVYGIDMSIMPNCHTAAFLLWISRKMFYADDINSKFTTLDDMDMFRNKDAKFFAAKHYISYMKNYVNNWFDKSNHVLFATGIQENNNGIKTVQVDYEGSEDDDQWSEIRDEIEATGKINGKSLIKLNLTEALSSAILLGCKWNAIL